MTLSWQAGPKILEAQLAQSSELHGLRNWARIRRFIVTGGTPLADEGHLIATSTAIWTKSWQATMAVQRQEVSVPATRFSSSLGT